MMITTMIIMMMSDVFSRYRRATILHNIDNDHHHDYDEDDDDDLEMLTVMMTLVMTVVVLRLISL